jgi:hypothetical protein
MNVAQAPVERPYRVGVDHLGDYQRDCVRQAERAVASLQRCGVIGDRGADRDRLAAVCEVSGCRKRLAAHASRAEEDLRSRRRLRRRAPAPPHRDVRHPPRARQLRSWRRERSAAPLAVHGLLRPRGVHRVFASTSPRTLGDSRTTHLGSPSDSPAPSTTGARRSPARASSRVRRRSGRTTSRSHTDGRAVPSFPSGARSSCLNYAQASVPSRLRTTCPRGSEPVSLFISEG